MKMKSLKAIILLVVAVIVMSTTLSSFALVNNIQSTKQTGKMLSKEVFKHQIDTLEKHVTRSADGTLSLNVNQEVIDSLGMTSEDIDKFKSGLQLINKK